MKIFKKGVLCMFAALLGLAVFTGCSKENEPFSYYQLGPAFPNINADTDPYSLEYQIADEIVKCMLGNSLVYTNAYQNGIVIKGAVESENDAQAMTFYNNKLIDLQKLISDGKAAEAIRRGDYKDAQGNKMEVGTGTVVFEYKMTKGLSVISNFFSTAVTVEY